MTLRAGSLIAIEGMGQTGLGSNYGDGFATDSRVQVSKNMFVACRPAAEQRRYMHSVSQSNRGVVRCSLHAQEAPSPEMVQMHSLICGQCCDTMVGWVQGNAQQDPNPFFAAALAAPWGANIVLSPHIYAPCAIAHMPELPRLQQIMDRVLRL